MYMCKCASMRSCVYVFLCVSVRERDGGDGGEKTKCAGENESLADGEIESERIKRESA